MDNIYVIGYRIDIKDANDFKLAEALNKAGFNVGTLPGKKFMIWDSTHQNGASLWIMDKEHPLRVIFRSCNMSHECNNVSCFDDSPHDCHDESCEVCNQEESEAVKVLRAVVEKLHRMPFSPKEFLGSGLWSEIQDVLGEKDEEE